MASTLDNIGRDELSKVIEFRWQVASGSKNHPFTSDAIDALFALSGGMPREACILADNSLLAGYLAQETQLDAKFVEYAAKERIDNTLTDKAKKQQEHG